MDTDSVCWVCSLRIGAGDRTTRLSSLGIDVHARCADTVLRDEPPSDDEESVPE